MSSALADRSAASVMFVTASSMYCSRRELSSGLSTTALLNAATIALRTESGFVPSYRNAWMNPSKSSKSSGRSSARAKGRNASTSVSITLS